MVLQWLTTRSNTTCTHEMPALFMRFTVSAYMQVCIWLCCWENVSKTVEEKHRQTGGAGIFVYISKWLCVCHTTIYAACVHHILSNGRNFRICTLVATVYQRGKGKTTLYDDPSFALEQKHSMEFHQLYQTFNSFESSMNTELAMVISTEVHMGIYNISTFCFMASVYSLWGQEEKI